MPHQFGKNYRMAAEKIEAGHLYPPREAVELVRATSMTKYDPTIEAHFRLGIDPRHADQAVRTTVVLPHGTGRTRRIAVFATGEKAREALEAGADLVGGEDLVKQVQAGQIDFDVALATPDVMGSSAASARSSVPGTDAQPQGGDGHLRHRQGRPGGPGWPHRGQERSPWQSPCGHRQGVLRRRPVGGELRRPHGRHHACQAPAAKGTYLKSLTLCTTHGPASGSIPHRHRSFRWRSSAVAEQPIRLLIVDDIQSTRDNLRKLLSFEDDIEVVGTAGDGKEGVEEAQRLHPDIVLTT